jgi:hypothetical protein
LANAKTKIADDKFSERLFSFSIFESDKKLEIIHKTSKGNSLCTSQQTCAILAGMFAFIL